MFDLQSVCFKEVTHEGPGSLVDGRTFGDCLELLWEGTMLEIWKGNYIHDTRRGNQNNRIRNPPAEAAARVMNLDVLRVFNSFFRMGNTGGIRFLHKKARRNLE